MFRSAKELIGHRIHVGNQCLGIVADLFLDYDMACVRNFEVIRTDSKGQTRFLVSPSAVGSPNWINGILPLLETPEEKEYCAEGSSNRLTALSVLLGHECVGIDDAVGQVYDFLFNTEDWSVNYCIIDIRKYHFRRVIVPMARVRIDYEESATIHVELTKKQVFEGVSLDPTQPVDYQIRKFAM